MYDWSSRNRPRLTPTAKAAAAPATGMLEAVSPSVTPARENPPVFNSLTTAGRRTSASRTAGASMDSFEIICTRAGAVRVPIAWNATASATSSVTTLTRAASKTQAASAACGSMGSTCPAAREEATAARSVTTRTEPENRVRIMIHLLPIQWYPPLQQPSD